MSDPYEIKEQIEKYQEGIVGRGPLMYAGGMEFHMNRRQLDINVEAPSKDEIRSIVKKLSNGKGVGYDGIPYEFLKYGGEWLVASLEKLFQRVWMDERIPAKWNESKVILLFKGGHKSKQELKNYRPISLGNTIGKVFCSIINERIKEACERSGLIGEEQNGFRKDRRGEDNVFVLRELIEAYSRQKKILYLAFLDIEKAYDKVNRRTLVSLLGHVGLHPKLTKLIEGMYANTKAKYIFGDIETRWVKVERGVRQGCVLSPLLFSIYTEELATRVRESRLGIDIGGDNLGVLLYADDVVLIADDPCKLQGMLDICFSFGNEFSMSYGKDKCGVISVGCEGRDNRETFKIGHNIVKRVHSYEYLGVALDEEGAGRAKADKIFKANQWWGRLCAISKFRANKYEVGRGLWKGVAVPSLMYGMDTVQWSKEEMDRIEVIQNRVGRLALGANRIVAVEAIRGDLGWSSFEERMYKAKLRYKVRLEKMDENRWAKKVYKMTFGVSKWIGSCVRIVNKCGLARRYVGVEGRGREWNLALSPGDTTDYTVANWKVLVNQKVGEYGLQRWRARMDSPGELPTLKWYSKKRLPSYEAFYDGSWGSSLLFKARSGSLETDDRTYRYRGDGSRLCQNCNLQVAETVMHLIAECPAYNSAREYAMAKIIGLIGCDEFDRVAGLEDYGMTYFLGLEEGVPRGVVKIVKTLLCCIWLQRGLLGHEGGQLLEVRMRDIDCLDEETIIIRRE